MSKLLDKLASASTIKHSAILSDSKFFADKEETSTDLPILNLAFGGSIESGFSSGLITIAGPSKHYKSNLGLYCVASYLTKHKDAVCLYYDSEFGAPPAYLKTFGIDTTRVIHSPVKHIEQLKFDITNQLEIIERGDKVIIFIDSIGNLASKKEGEDALNEKSVGDMSRAKSLKSLWRIVTPELTIKDIPCININHTYETMEMFSKAVVSGGTGGMYSSNTVFIIGRAQEKDGTELAGYKFTINIEKSRFVREKSKFAFNVYFNSGINKWSGLLDLAVDMGFVVKPKNGWYTRPTILDDKNWRSDATNCEEFWKPLFDGTNFDDALQQKFRLGAYNDDIDEVETSYDEDAI